MNFLRQQVVSPAVIALGSNLGDREGNIRAAIAALNELDGVTVTSVSGLVESHAVKPEGVDAASPNYLNAVILASTTLMPEELLAALHSIEALHGRIRVERWGDRTLDLDIISYGALERHDKALTLPHPRAWQRPFVLVPWLQADAGATLHGHGAVAELAASNSAEVWPFEASNLAPAPQPDRGNE